MTGRHALRTLRAVTAGLILLVVALTPLHAHGGAEAPTVCLLCQVTHQALDLPDDAQATAWQPPRAGQVPADPAPRDLPNAEVCNDGPGNPRAPPLHS